jgi:hypothetical protein
MTAFFRMIGAGFPNFDAASKVSGFSITALILYIGYQIPKPHMYVYILSCYLREGLPPLVSIPISPQSVPSFDTTTYSESLC